MNQEELKSLIRETEFGAQAASGCPEDEILASYLEGGLGESDHASFQKHLADCLWCMDRVGILGRANSEEVNEELPEFVLARARRLVQPQSIPTPAWRRRAPGWATAALLLLALSLFMRGPLPEAPTADRPGIRTERNFQPLMPTPRLLSPAAGVRVDLAHDSFDWSPVAGSIYYRVRIVSDAGDLLWQERVQGTHWTPPPDLHLETGAEYFARIDAYLARDKSVSSDYVAFRVGEPR